MSSAWASGCAVSQTYGRNYQRKMEIKGGLGLIQSPVPGRCVRITGTRSGSRVLEDTFLTWQCRELAAFSLLPPAWQCRLSAAARVTFREPWAPPRPALPSSLLALPIPALYHRCQEQDGSGHLIQRVTPSGQRGWIIVLGSSHCRVLQ